MFSLVKCVIKFICLIAECAKEFAVCGSSCHAKHVHIQGNILY